MRNRKILSLLLATALLLSTCIIEVSAASTQLPPAVDNVIKLTDDVVLSDEYFVDEDMTLTIDLNGYTLTSTCAGDPLGDWVISIDNYGDLTITDSTEGHNGTLRITGEATNGIVNRSNLTVKDCNIETNSYGIITARGATTTVESVTIRNIDDAYSGIENSSTGHTIIKNSNILGFISPQTAICDYGNGKIEIEGGIFEGAVTIAEGTVAKFNGGSFSTVPEIEIPLDAMFVREGDYYVYKSDLPSAAEYGGNQYVDIARAMTAAFAGGGKITILKDTAIENAKLSTEKDVEIDLAGHTLEFINKSQNLEGTLKAKTNGSIALHGGKVTLDYTEYGADFLVADGGTVNVSDIEIAVSENRSGSYSRPAMNISNNGSVKLGAGVTVKGNFLSGGSICAFGAGCNPQNTEIPLGTKFVNSDGVTKLDVSSVLPEGCTQKADGTVVSESEEMVTVTISTEEGLTTKVNGEVYTQPVTVKMYSDVIVEVADSYIYTFDGWSDGSTEKKLSFLSLDKNIDLTAKVKVKFADTAEPVEADADGVYHITKPQQLLYLGKLAFDEQKNFKGETISIDKNLNFKGVEFFPLGGTGCPPFAGTIEGNGKTISNIDGTVVPDYSALVGRTANGAVIQNLTVKDSTFDPKGTLNDNRTYAGAFAGSAGGATIKNCVADNVTVDGWFAGAIAGHGYGITAIEDSIVRNCTVSGTKNGGVVGFAGGANISGVTVQDSTINGGAVIGQINEGNNNIEDVVVSEVVNDEGNKVGLIEQGAENEDTNPTITIGGDNTNADVSDIVTDMGESKHEDVTVNGGQFGAVTIPEEMLGENVETITGEDGGVTIVPTIPPEESHVTGRVEVIFDTTGTPNKYKIKLAAMDEGKVINEFTSAEIKFRLVTDDSIGYTIEPAKNINLIDGTEPDSYQFNVDGINDVHSKTGKTVEIGTVTFDGYGNATFNAIEYVAAKVNTTKEKDNIVDTYIPNPTAEDEGKLEFPEINALVLEIARPAAELTVNVTFPNRADDQAAAYQDMKVTVSGGDLRTAIECELGKGGEYTMTNGAYSLEFELSQGITYTVKVEGAGYRTSRCTVNMSEAKTLTFWNNVMDNAQAIETGKATGMVTKNFLAGDIVKDNNINIYDLSAVVSYFGSINDVTAASDYAKYDLNRDGVIDSKDVAYVLVSWGE